MDKKWSRHKETLHLLGVGLTFDSEAYWVDRGARSDLVRTRAGAAQLAAALRALPVPTGGVEEVDLERALIKLAAQGAPIVGAMVARRLGSNMDERRVLGSTGLALGCLTLINVLLSVGDDGLFEDEAAACCGASDRTELASVLRVLIDVSIPLDAPLDTTGVDLIDGRVTAYLRFRQPWPLRHTAAEFEALHGIFLASQAASVGS